MSYCVQTSHGMSDESVSSHEEPSSRFSDLSSLSQDDDFHSPSYSSDDDDAAQEQVSIQQERLLQLRHAINCPHRANCPVSRHCGNMRKLWRHMLRCKAEFCSIPYCVSSRFLLQHYRSCPKDTCAVCRPVRDTYKRPRSETEEREILESTPNKRRRISSGQFGFPPMVSFSAFPGRMQNPTKIEDGCCGVEPMLRSIALDDSPRAMRTADH